MSRVTLGPITAVTAMSSRMRGIDNCRSASPMTRLSVHPPRYPAIRPSAAPITRLMLTAMIAIRNDTRPANASRLKQIAPQRIGAQQIEDTILRAFTDGDQAVAQVLLVGIVER